MLSTNVCVCVCCVLHVRVCVLKHRNLQIKRMVQTIRSFLLGESARLVKQKIVARLVSCHLLACSCAQQDPATHANSSSSLSPSVSTGTSRPSRVYVGIPMSRAHVN